jgi:preprotein translocase subunit SecA
MRQVERQVMLRIIDQRWREHLYEMDYLKEGIHLRAMGQKDPLVEWQREGFDMFGQMMNSIAQDFVRYVTHIQVTEQAQQPAPAEQPATNVEYSGPDDPSGGAKAMKASAASRVSVDAALGDAPAVVQENPERTQTPVVKSEWEKTGRNEPCPCGSGKKFKACHGQ